MFKSILVGINAEFPDPGTLEQAVTVAKRNEARLKLLDSVPEFSWLSKAFTPRHKQLLQMLIEERLKNLETIAVDLGSRGLDVSVCCRTGNQSEALIQEAQTGKHDLIIRVAKGRNSRRKGAMGTSALRLLRKCPCALWLTKRGETKPAGRVMAAVDATPDDEDHGQLNAKILNLALQFCEDQNHLFAAYIWEVFGESIFRSKMPAEEFAEMEKEFQERNAASLRKVLAENGLSLPEANVFMRHGDPVEMIPQLLQDQQIDLLVMGTVARTGIPGMLMGNTAEALVENIECGLLTIKPDAFDSPVGAETI